MMKNVGIDIDCVMTDLDIVLKKMAEYYDKPLAVVEDVMDYNISSIYDTPEEESISFWDEHEGWICENSELAKDRFEKILDMFVEEGDRVFIITSRSYDHTDVTAQWLEDNEIEHEMLILTDGKSKLPVISYFGIDVMIDDKPELFAEVENSDLETKMVCVDYPYNKDVKCDIRLDREGNVL